MPGKYLDIGFMISSDNLIIVYIENNDSNSVQIYPRYVKVAWEIPEIK